MDPSFFLPLSVHTVASMGSNLNRTLHDSLAQRLGGFNAPANTQLTEADLLSLVASSWQLGIIPAQLGIGKMYPERENKVRSSAICDLGVWAPATALMASRQWHSISSRARSSAMQPSSYGAGHSLKLKATGSSEGSSVCEIRLHPCLCLCLSIVDLSVCLMWAQSRSLHDSLTVALCD